MKLKNTKERYMNALLFACGQPQFHSREFAKAFKVSHTMITVMCELGLIKKVDKATYKWALQREPLPTDVALIRKRLSAYNQFYKGRSSQLTIAPIRKAPVSTPQPIVHEAEYDNSNSKVLLILAVGAVIGFMIATLIWK
jgi:hypothetical protein